MVHTKIPVSAFILFLIIGVSTAFSQSIWEPQTNITGYFSTEFNYFDDLEGYDYNYGAALSEAGLLINHKPTSNFTLKGVFVYRPDFKIDKMVNELSGEYKLTPYLNVKGGRFLQTLSPMNTYYYAPVNTSATLPIIVSNNEFFPLNINGVSLNGSTGNNFRFKYDVFAGSYSNDVLLATGGLGFFGTEMNYFNQLNGTAAISLGDFTNMAVGGSVGFAYKNFIEVGFGAFNPRNEITNASFYAPEGYLYPESPAQSVEMELEIEKLTYGSNFKLQYNSTKLVGEIWTADMKLNMMGSSEDFDLNGYYAELSHNINKVTPYLRYEDQTVGDIDYTRFTGGINYKPTFETTFKLEYLQYNNDAGDINGLVGAFIFSF